MFVIVVVVSLVIVVVVVVAVITVDVDCCGLVDVVTFSHGVVCDGCSYVFQLSLLIA